MLFKFIGNPSLTTEIVLLKHNLSLLYIKRSENLIVKNMKITKVKSFVSASGHFFVKVETDAGIYGVGEGGLRRRAVALAEVVRSYEPFLIGGGSLPDRASVANDVPWCFFPGWRRPIRRSECRGYCTLGHQRKSTKCTHL